ncbi:hypothetical protein AAFF_G00051620 [Aldrovandia affinis]|uniref:Uncharacterized protein n=1 Tax=Aldrovandia affinis TaxID=143900 RepID=A0AAD7T5Q2_9TELE|nr:hypothetical protein AAFF_G00051620 [Aldrovandia affinis]
MRLSLPHSLHVSHGNTLATVNAHVCAQVPAVSAAPVGDGKAGVFPPPVGLCETAWEWRRKQRLATKTNTVQDDDAGFLSHSSIKKRKPSEVFLKSPSIFASVRFLFVEEGASENKGLSGTRRSWVSQRSATGGEPLENPGIRQEVAAKIRGALAAKRQPF